MSSHEICNAGSVQNDSNTVGKCMHKNAKNCGLGYRPGHCRRFQFSTINNKKVPGSSSL